MILETKLDSSFPEGQFLILGYSSPYHFDRNCREGGVMLYIPSKLLSIESQTIEVFYIEINFRGKNGCFVIHIIHTGIILATTMILLVKT